MASTRLTTKIKRKIADKGRELFTARISKKINSLRPDFWDDVVDKFVTTYFYPYQDNKTYPDYPDDWYINIQSIDVHFVDSSRETRLMERLNKEYKIIAIKSYLSGGQLDIHETKMDNLLLAEYFQYDDQIKKLRTEQNDFTTELKRVLDNCNTLSQFLKVWPQGEHLITDLDFETKTRTRRKQEIEVDQATLDTLNVGLLKQTMLNK